MKLKRFLEKQLEKALAHQDEHPLSGSANRDVKEARKADRIILITDEQSRDRVSGPKNYGADVGYIINVASYQNGVNHGEWTTVTGFSEAIVDFIRESENN